MPHWPVHRVYHKNQGKTESCNDANFVITGGTGGCHYDNLQCHQWWQSWHHNNSQFSMSMHTDSPRVYFVMVWHKSVLPITFRVTLQGFTVIWDIIVPVPVKPSWGICINGFHEFPKKWWWLIKTYQICVHMLWKILYFRKVMAPSCDDPLQWHHVSVKSSHITSKSTACWTADAGQ